MKNFLKQNWFKLAILFFILIFIFFLFLGNKRDIYLNEISQQDLVLKCQEIYTVKHDNFEESRYGGVDKADAIIWSPKTKTCLAYYNVPQTEYNHFLFEVWDYSIDDLVLSYSSYPSSECVESSRQQFMYKFNSSLNGYGCDFPLMESGIDLITNFEKAMQDVGFKK